jgi:hypothetical protein
VTFNVAASTGWNAANGLAGGTLVISKAIGATVSTPTLNTRNHNSITINPVTAANGQSVEYIISTNTIAPSSGWQTSTTFSGLNAATTYRIFARSIENNNFLTGIASNSLIVTTLQTVPENRFEFYWVDQHGSLVTTSGGAVTINAGSTFTITAQATGYIVRQWYLNGINTGQSGNTFIFSSTTTGRYIIGLFVEKDSKLYNTNITITVQ